MARILDLPDIQGNIVRGYGGSFPKASYVCVHFDDPEAGRRFVERMLPRVTTAVRWASNQSYHGERSVPKPPVCVNIAFSFLGLLALRLPTATLSAMPPEFIDGMARRAGMLGDDCAQWDAVWRPRESSGEVHALITLSAQIDPKTAEPVPELAQARAWIADLCHELDGQVRILGGHGRGTLGDALEASALFGRNDQGDFTPLPIEHFGLTDGFGDPVFDGQYPKEEEAEAAIGRGKTVDGRSWQPIATGEFLLGYPDEAQEVPPAAMPYKLTRNGTFMVMRKLHENVAAFHDYMARTGRAYAAITGVGQDDAEAFITAKMVGRWPDGIPTAAAPTIEKWHAFQAHDADVRRSRDAAAIRKLDQSYIDFTYRADPGGLGCPVTAHIRRANTRDALDPTGSAPEEKQRRGSVLNNRRRLLRRGLPYGAAEATPTDAAEHGVVFIAICASIFRQFEFVQQQWMQYGLDFGAGSDSCPIVGHHGAGAKFVIPGNAQTGPFFCANLPQFIESRGGEYFFVPSLTGLRMIGMGTVDPT